MKPLCKYVSGAEAMQKGVRPNIEVELWKSKYKISSSSDGMGTLQEICFSGGEKKFQIRVSHKETLFLVNSEY